MSTKALRELIYDLQSGRWALITGGSTNEHWIPLHAVIVSGLQKDLVRAASRRYKHQQARPSGWGPLQNGWHISFSSLSAYMKPEYTKAAVSIWWGHLESVNPGAGCVYAHLTRHMVSALTQITETITYHLHVKTGRRFDYWFEVCCFVRRQRMFIIMLGEINSLISQNKGISHFFNVHFGSNEHLKHLVKVICLEKHNLNC